MIYSTYQDFLNRILGPFQTIFDSLIPSIEISILIIRYISNPIFSFSPSLLIYFVVGEYENELKKVLILLY